MDPRLYLELSKAILEHQDFKDKPATCRTAISRSYYAALNVASGLLDELKIPVGRGADSHKEIMDTLADGEDPKLRAAMTSLARQKKSRKDADYCMDTHDVENSRHASMLYVINKKIIDDLDNIRNDAARWATIADLIKKKATAIGKIPRGASSGD